MVADFGVKGLRLFLGCTPPSDPIKKGQITELPFKKRFRQKSVFLKRDAEFCYDPVYIRR